MSTQWVFGYGSLLNLTSVHDTVPEITELRTCFIKGFRRDFSFWSEIGFVTTNPDVDGIPFYALNVTAMDSVEQEVNGVIFQVDDHQFQKLALREHGYTLIQTVAYDFVSGEPLQDCIVYSAVPCPGELFDFTSAAQLRYLQICLDGAASFGTDFHKQFIDTTYIGNRKLSAIDQVRSRVQ